MTFVHNAVIVIMLLISVPTTGFVAIDGCFLMKELFFRRFLFMHCRGSMLFVLTVVLDLGVARILIVVAMVGCSCRWKMTCQKKSSR